MSLPCPVPRCDRVMPGHLTVCRACAEGLKRALDHAPSIAAELDITRTRQARLGDDHARGPRHGLPYDERAAEAADALRHVLMRWCRAVADSERMPDTEADMARWLASRRARLLRHPAAAEAVHDLVRAVERARSAIDRAPDRIYAGPCARCQRDLYARLDTTIVSCVCGAAYGIQARREWMLGEVRQMLGNASWVAAVAAVFGEEVTPAAVRGMANRQRITARGRDIMGHPIYRVGDVLDVLAARAVG